MKVLRNKNLFGLLFAVLLAIPMINIAVRCIYVQSNKNAKDSYSGENESVIYYTPITNSLDLVLGDTYYVTNNTESYYNSYFIGCQNIQNVLGDTNHDYTLPYFLRTYESGNIVFFGQNQNTLWTLYPTTKVSFTFELTSFVTGYAYNAIQKINYNDSYNLDNAFEYSVNHFISNNNFGKVNFFNWFTDMFFENNLTATTYVQFANWYMNYALLISLGYILFLVLIWFVNYARKLLTKGLDFGEGSY